MNPFTLFDPSRGPLQAKIAQRELERNKYITDSTPRPELPEEMMYYQSWYYQKLGVTETSNTSKAPHSTEKIVSEKKFQAMLKRIEVVFNEDKVSLARSTYKRLICDGLNKITEVLGDESGKNIKKLVEYKKTNPQVKTSMLSLLFFSSLYSVDTLTSVKKSIDNLVKKLIEFKNCKNSDAFDMDFCHQLSDRIFNTITKGNIKSHLNKIKKNFQPHLLLNKEGVLGGRQGRFSEQQKDYFIKLINEKFDTKKETVLADLSVNKLVQNFNFMNFVYGVSDNLETAIFSDYKNGGKKCQVL
ncbi:hypothetical protein F3I35_15975 [Pantoea sp. Bo_7]|uniref:hypothetical protein n=1 Tax=unclassified Pantoea TaxID=2630326 RepID=UPI0012329AC5|nr:MULTISPECIES: hypothetical protein [unclassified Pantoea]KAA6043269.1 hypothetical protein F3I35_15975 [Pantoea sp. Bo_7]KAA6088253.1 hypothetical protein F3I22_16475 [Pantoea sp. Bo_10]